MNSKDREQKNQPILAVENLCVAYGKIKALKEISFQVYSGEIVSLLGSNGAGKTTTLNAISGIVPAQSGKIVFRGQNLVGMPTHKIVQCGIAHVPEGRRIFPELTVEENLHIAGYLFSNRNKPLLEQRMEYIFSLFPRLKERRQQAGGTLSGGEQQMLAIGRALITGGDLLLMDEPSMGIAPNLVEEIFATIQTINQKNGLTIFLVEQNAMMAMEISNYCYVLETGVIAHEGVSKDLMQDDSVARAYLGESI
ncbi:MAG: ABC transporter ATP-binding protein [Anaerolineae bacterium]|nr:ABC transporter ATP-binding protein [Anaerolineae bacterium]